MRREKFTNSCLVASWLILGLAVTALAGGSPGDMIDKTNWETIEGKVPESLLGWIKQGDWKIQIQELNYDVNAYHPEFALETFKTNAGKYGLDPHDGIVDLATGKPPKFIVGIPFPEIDTEDPKAAVKIMHNNHYMQYILGDLRFPFSLTWVSPSGREREIGATWRQASMDGWPGARDRGNPDRIEKYALALVDSPFDIKGTAIMTWRYLDPMKQDSSFGYFPAIRRVRRMSPGNRSDAFVGSDLSVDDANGYDGKVAAMEWRLVATQEAIVPWYDTDPVRVVQNDEGEWVTTTKVKELTYGFEDEGWQGKPWAPTNLAWVKRPVYLIEMKPKDKYYNYGTHYAWVDTETFAANYKVIHDRSGAYWKTFLKGDVSCSSSYNKMKFLTVGFQQMVDDRREHSTIVEDFSPRNVWAYFAKLQLDDFSLGGLQKYTK